MNVPQPQHICISTLLHMRPQAPQFEVSCGVQLPLQHSSVGLQILPQLPQLRRSVSRFWQPPAQHVVPLPQAGPLLQVQVWPVQVLPALHGGTQPVATQWPIAQPLGHWTSHAPQCAGSLARSKQPAAQQVWLPTHAGPPAQLQLPPVHASPTLQRLPQKPQFFGSLVVSEHIDPPVVLGSTQQLAPLVHAVAPHRHWPCEQVSPVAHE